MKALVKFKKGSGLDTLKYMDVPEPVPAADEIKIKIIAAGVCGTDIHIMLDEFPNTPPVILGHEYVGIVCDKGKNVSGFEIGDYVISLTAVKTCGKCRYCYLDLRMHCPERNSIGVHIDGAMAEYMVVPAEIAFKVPPEVIDKEALVISEPAVCAVRAVIERSNVKSGDVVLVSGPGIMGQLIMQTAKITDAYVIVSGLPSDQERLMHAKALGADDTASNTEELSTILNRVAPDGADVVFECAAHESSARTCIDAVRNTGMYVQVGLFGKEVNIDMDKLLYKEVTVTNSFATERSSWEIYLRLIKDKRLNLKPFITKKIPLDKWESAFETATRKEGYKTILTP